jgi:hypothetical protein
MSTTDSLYQPAIDALEKDLAALERQGNELIGAINVLRAKAGLPPRPGLNLSRHADTNAGSAPAESASATPAQLRSDTFFGKRMGTAAREFLEMRKGQGLGAAKTRDIFEGLKVGGFQFETKDDSIALISVRNMLRKRTEMFQRLPNGTYGLKAWYQHVRQPKGSLAPEAEKGADQTASKPEQQSNGTAAAAA